MPVAGFNRPGDGGSGLKLGDKLNFVNNLVAKSQPSTMADSVLTLINKVANLGYVGSKRWASGTSTAAASGLNWDVASGGSGAYPYFTISGLSFKPSTVHAWATNGHYSVWSQASGDGWIIPYYGGSSSWGGYVPWVNNGAHTVASMNLQVGGVTLPWGGYAADTVHWIAYE